MTKQELLKKLIELHKDTREEDNHIEADNLLLEYINNEEITTAFNKIDKWYS